MAGKLRAEGKRLVPRLSKEEKKRRLVAKVSSQVAHATQPPTPNPATAAVMPNPPAAAAAADADAPAQQQQSLLEGVTVPKEVKSLQNEAACAELQFLPLSTAKGWKKHPKLSKVYGEQQLLPMCVNCRLAWCLTDRPFNIKAHFLSTSCKLTTEKSKQDKVDGENFMYTYTAPGCEEFTKEIEQCTRHDAGSSDSLPTPRGC